MAYFTLGFMAAVACIASILNGLKIIQLEDRIEELEKKEHGHAKGTD